MSMTRRYSPEESTRMIMEIRNAMTHHPESYQTLRAKMAPIIIKEIIQYPDDTLTGRFLKLALTRCPETSVANYMMAHTLAAKEGLNPGRLFDHLLTNFEGSPEYGDIVKDLQDTQYQDSGARAISRRIFLKGGAQLAGAMIGIRLATGVAQNITDDKPVESADMLMHGLEAMACYGAFRLAADTQIRDDVSHVLNNFNSKLANDINRTLERAEDRRGR